MSTSTTPIFIVTGGNKGIGRACVELLLQSAPPASLIYLTSRDPHRGQQSLKDIQNQAKSATQLAYHQLDVGDPDSIQQFAAFIREQHPQKIHALINNAGINVDSTGFNSKNVRKTLQTNFYGLKSMCEQFAPLTQDSGRIVNVSSMACKTHILKSNALKQQFHDQSATPEDIVKLMTKFQNDVDAGRCTQEGWPELSYTVSKMGVTGFTRAFAKQHPNLFVNAVCPSYISTGMTSHMGAYPPEEGASRVVHLALADLNGVSGAFWENKKVSTW